jgi:hypothetical protein
VPTVVSPALPPPAEPLNEELTIEVETHLLARRLDLDRSSVIRQ